MKPYIYRHKGKQFFNIFWLAGNALLQTATSVGLTFQMNAVFALNVQAMLFWSAINLGLWIMFLLSNYFQGAFEIRLIEEICLDLRTDQAVRISHFDYQTFHRQKNSQYISQYTNDVFTIETKYLTNLYALIANIFRVISSMVTLAFYHWTILGVSLILAGLLLTLPKYISKPLQKANAMLSASNEKLIFGITNLLGGFDVLFSYNRLHMLPNLVKTEAKAYAEDKISYTQTEIKVQNSISFLSILAQVAVDVITCYLAISHIIPLGSVASTGNLSATLFNSLSQISNLNSQIRGTEPVVKKIAFVEADGSKEGVSKLVLENSPSFEDMIKITDLTYSVDDKVIFQDLNLKIKKGEKIAITGRSGLGKSTLLKIISGQITDYTGQVAIDSQGIDQFSQQNLNQLITYIDQKPYLFTDTIKNNVSLWQDNVSNADVTAALTSASIDFVADMDQLVLDNGTNLSIGQQQRLALARYYVSSTPIALMDEGTAALDHMNGVAVEKELLSDPMRTVIEVTHKLNEENKGLYSRIIDLEDLMK